MKINQLLFLIIAPITLRAYTVDDLETAIKDSDESLVQEVVKDVQVTENDKSRLLVLAQDMIEQRKTKYQSLFVANNSFLRLFDYSWLKVGAIACGAGLIFAGIMMDKKIPQHILICHEYSTYYERIRAEVRLFIPVYTAVGLVSATIINFGARVKYFYDTKKQYDRAINIKQLVYKSFA